MKTIENRITVNTLIEHLKSYPGDKELYFGGLEFYRLKDRGDVVQVEFSETVYQDDAGRIKILAHREK